MFAAICGAVCNPGGFNTASGHDLGCGFATTGSLRNQSSAALMALIPFPMLAIVRTHLYGIALRIGRPRVVWIGTVVGVAAVPMMGLYVFAIDPNAGSHSAAIAVSVGAVAETLVLIVATAQPLRRTLGRAQGRAPEYGVLLRFFAPLMVAALLFVITPLIINETLTRALHSETSVRRLYWRLKLTKCF